MKVKEYKYFEILCGRIEKKDKYCIHFHNPLWFVAGFILGAIGVGSLCYSIGRYWSEIGGIIK